MWLPDWRKYEDYAFGFFITNIVRDALMKGHLDELINISYNYGKREKSVGHFNKFFSSHTFNTADSDTERWKVTADQINGYIRRCECKINHCTCNPL